MAISGHQWPSAYLALSGSSAPRWAQSVVIRGHQRTSPSQVRQRRDGHRTRRAARSIAHGHACWRRVARCRGRAPFGSHPPRPHLMKDSISGHQCSSIHLRLTQRHQWPSVLISAHQWGHQRSSVGPSALISGHQRSSVLISGHQRSSEAISAHQCSSVAISAHHRGHQRSSAAISAHQCSSVLISAHQCSFASHSASRLE